MDSTGTHATDLRGLELYSNDGKKIAEVEDVFLDDHTGEPEWLRLGVGFLGMKDVLVPLEAVTREGDKLTVSYSSDKIKDAPSIDGDYVSPEEESELYRYYGLAAASPSELNERGDQVPGTTSAGPAVSDKLGEAPSGHREGGTRIPEEQVFAAQGKNDPTQVRLRKWVDDKS